MKISNNWVECNVVPKFYKMTGHDISVKVDDDAPERAKELAEEIRMNIAKGKYDKDLNALYNDMLFRAAREGI